MTILTTHVGSLPRSKKLSDLLFKKENNEMYDKDSFNKVVKESVFDIVKKQRTPQLSCGCVVNYYIWVVGQQLQY